jgi:hypothetical protein
MNRQMEVRASRISSSLITSPAQDNRLGVSHAILNEKPKVNNELAIQYVFSGDVRR